jgi:hypothetical protein
VTGFAGVLASVQFLALLQPGSVMRHLILLALSAGAALAFLCQTGPATAQNASPQGTPTAESRISAEEVERFNSVGAEILKWIGEERRRQPSTPDGSVYKKIPQTVLCKKVLELLPERAAADDEDDRLQVALQPVTRDPDARANERHALSPYYLARRIRAACLSNKFEIYDPRIAEEPATGGDPRRLYEENYPACPKGPRVAIQRGDMIILRSAIESFDQLESLTFVCIGGQSPDNMPIMGLMGPNDGLSVRATEVLLLNTSWVMFGLQDARIGRLRIIGTSTIDDRHPTAYRGGALMGTLAIDRSEIGELRLGGYAISKVQIRESNIARAATITRSEFGGLVIANSKLHSLNIWQVRMTPGGAEHGQFSMDGGALMVIKNEIAQDFRLGALSDFDNATRQVNPALFDSWSGRRVDWTTPERNANQVRGFVTVGSNKIGGQLLVQGLDLAKGTSEGNSPFPNIDTSAFLNINELSAASINFAGNTLRFTSNASLIGLNVKVDGDIKFTSNVIHRFASDEIDPAKVNRFTTPTSTSSDGGHFTGPIGFYRLKARNVEFEQNLIVGPIVFVESDVRMIAAKTAGAEPSNRPSWSDFCIASPQKPLSESAGTLEGGAELAREWSMPSDAGRYPPCYGSVVIFGGTLDALVANGLLSDVLITGAQVKYAVVIAGRISGTANLGNMQIKDGIVALGSIGQPLLWCKDSELLMDGVRAAAFQADKNSFSRIACEAGDARILGPLRMSMRVARIDQIMGQARLSFRSPADAGLLGLSAAELKAIMAPLPARIGAQDEGATTFDPQTLSVFAAKLRDAGFIAKANELSMERVSRQKWESKDSFDRVKWLMGWPVGWGYQTEWAFLYAFGFVFIGAWVSAYYRDYPEQSPPRATWLRETLDERRQPADAARLRAAGVRFGITAAAIAMSVLAMIWLPQKLQLSQEQTLWVIGGLILMVVAWHLRLDTLLWRPDRKQRFLRIVAAMRHLGYHNFFFSLDRFLPSPGFHGYWASYPRIGQAGRNYFYLHRLIGLVLVTIAAAGAAGLFE